MEKTEQINEKFLEEYGSEDAVRKYTTGTAGFGINYLLRNDYARVYLSGVDSCLQTSPPHPLCLLEFGCGGGMNNISLVSLLEKKGIPAECAYGTDFSACLVQSAAQEAKASLTPGLAKKLSFHVARFMKTLKREEIYAKKYGDLENLRANIEEFIEQYYNRQRLHSALGYRSPEEFEQQIEASGSAESRSATMVFLSLIHI